MFFSIRFIISYLGLGLILFYHLTMAAVEDEKLECILDKSYTEDQKKIANQHLDRIKTLFGKEFNSVDGKYAYNFKVCGDSADAKKNDNLKYSTITQMTVEDKSITPLGRRNQTLVAGGKNWVMLTFLGGQKYDNSTCNHVNRLSHILFTCSKYKYEGSFAFVGESNVIPNCNHMFELQHHTLCGIDDVGLSSGAIFFIIVLVGFLCYFLFGFCYRRLVVGAKGVEQIPHREFWMKTGNLFANCCDMTCRCDKYCDENLGGSTPGSHNGYTPIGEQPRRGNSLNSDSALITP